MSAVARRVNPLVAGALLAGPAAAFASAMLPGSTRLIPPALAVVVAATGLGVASRDRRRTRQALHGLQLERQRLVSLLEESDVAVAALDTAGRYLDLGPRAVQILGWPEASLLGSPAIDRIDAADRGRIGELIALVASEPGSRRDGIRTRHRAADGGWIDLELSIANRVDDVSIQAIVMCAKDVSSHVAATSELEASLEQQVGVAQLGRRALEGADPTLLALEAIAIIRRTMGVDGVELYRHVASEELLLLEAALGPTRELAGLITIGSDECVPEVQSILERKTVVVDDLPTDQRFEIPPHLRFGGPHSTLSVPVTGPHRPYGALSVHSARRRLFMPDETVFVQSIANALGLALDRRRAEEETLHRAFHDALTGLPNRTLFVHRLQRALERTSVLPSRVGVFVVDLDHFKVINDSLGHELGDALLIEVAGRLRDCVRPGDMVARLGGDEFALMCEDATDTDRVESIAERIAEGLDAPIEIAGRAIHVRASVGVALPTSTNATAASLLRDADVALYQAKDRGRGGHAIFEETHRALAVTRLETESELRRALPAGELRVHYQPTVNLESGCTTGAEALVRWAHPTRGMIRPTEFIPIAEQTDLIDTVGRWVLKEACRQLAEWSAEPATAMLSVAVNLSARQLCQPGLTSEVALVIGQLGIDPAKLCLEITESALMVDLDRAIQAVRELKTLGLRIAVDDFGTGYSSLSYLTRLPVDVVKIDRSFISAIAHDDQDRAITRGIIDLAHSLRLEVVAEGVETDEQRALLQEMGCDLAQGFLFARPDVPSAMPLHPTVVDHRRAPST
jgi:diguanylate cyclase (GGDEF)-like protein/PAS domain S-box-containing protein